MKLGLPDSYPSTVNLPFNRESLNRDFQFATPDRDPGTPGVWLLLQGHKLLYTSITGIPALPGGDIPPVKGQRAPLYIGNWQGQACRLLTLPAAAEQPAGLESESLMARNPQLPLALLSLAGVGQMILHWERTSGFCGQCAAAMVRLPGEWGKECRACNNHHFPRIHPCVIGLVIREDKLLLVRKPEWVGGRFGLVAGFVEFGESLEEAMAREVAEETGLRIGNLRYVGSQCWPFPSQLMTGFVADYQDGEIDLLDQELAEAGWYSLDQLPTLPPQRSIARYLIDRADEYLHY